MTSIYINESCVKKARAKKAKARKTVKGSCSTKFVVSKSNTKGK